VNRLALKSYRMAPTLMDAIALMLVNVPLDIVNQVATNVSQLVMLPTRTMVVTQMDVSVPSTKNVALRTAHKECVTQPVPPKVSATTKTTATAHMTLNARVDIVLVIILVSHSVY
jgi:hypothetical protein